MPRYPQIEVRMFPRNHPDMNALAIRGRAHSALREHDLDDAWEDLDRDLTAGDYEHLLSVMRRTFTLVDGERSTSPWLNTTRRIHGADGFVSKPCHLTGFCVYGQLVEAFPTMEPETEELMKTLAEEHGYWVKMEATDDDATIFPVRWVETDGDDPDATPDLNRLIAEGLFDPDADQWRCRLFGHSCPAAYLAEAVAEPDNEESDR